MVALATRRIAGSAKASLFRMSLGYTTTPVKIEASSKRHRAYEGTRLDI
jgi:hypothetical protein